MNNALEEALGIEANKNMMPLQPGDVLETSADTKALNTTFAFQRNTITLYRPAERIPVRF